MRFTSRLVVLTAAICLPLGAALASYALTAEPEPPRVPPPVRVGGVDVTDSVSPSTTTTTTTTTTPPPQTQVVPPAPPVDDDDDDDDDDGD